MIQYMLLCKEDSIKRLAYGRILTRIFERLGAFFDGLVGKHSSDCDYIDHDAFTRVHLAYSRDRWLFVKCKFKSPSSPNFFQPNFIIMICKS